MTTRSEFDALAAPMRANLKAALAALSDLAGSDYADEEAAGKLAKACYLASLASRGIAALMVEDADFAFVKGSNVILNTDI